MNRSQAVTALRAAVRISFPILILLGCAMLLSRQIPGDVLATLPRQLADISVLQWACAALLTVGSFAAVAQYDVQAHRTLNTGISARRGRISGAVGIAIGQTVGFGLLSGAVARWRMLPDMGVGQALKLSTFVSLSFVAAWACVTGIICAVLPAPPWTMALSLAALVLLPAAAALLFWRPTLRIGTHRIPLPSLRVSGAILLWATVDMVLAAAALWVLLPAGTLPYFALLPLFMVALGCGLVSNTPGGIGPFELVLVSALPLGAEAGVLAAILAFRLVYYAAPACLAMAAMLRPLPVPQVVERQQPGWHSLPRSEALALRQNGGQIARAGSAMAPVWRTAQTETLFTDPTATQPDVVRGLTRLAARHGRIPVIYKAGRRLAQVARNARWAILHVADDAIVDLDGYDLTSPARRRLRRKLRAAEKAGITIRAGHMPDAQSAAQLDRDWQRRCGPARGGSMGRYCPDYVSDQWVVSAYSGDALIAFATFHRGAREWCLDIMRQGPTAPDGTMHALVHRGLEAAQGMGVARVSLASVIACPDPQRAVWRWATARAVVHAGGTGLRQFKSAYAPRWVPRYAAAPNWLALALGLADIARTIRAPDPLPAPAFEAVSAKNANNPHQEDENYELASPSAA
ncbi:phosphatidylglycerol lysyltransferase domain-containing protein [Tateyamaria sp. syn59]|uniref:phosphatidylglycerol lysyltransferase domain-containing protein n=1 Tax=Tateyamaria sp. syn59 TaxID=2576942 RepID=UPI0011BF6430|nr:phosphatidylglycerol lysyltransferase domain-containing protein [Tateyamaria sp. syn59]